MLASLAQEREQFLPLRLRYLLLLPLLEDTPEDLAGPALGQLIYELHLPRALVGRHLAPGPLDDVLLRDLALLLLAQHDHRFGGLAATLVGDADDHRFLDGRVLVEGALDLRRPDVVAAHVDHALEAVHHEEVALFVHRSDVAGPQETPAGALEEGLLVSLGAFPVALHHLRSRGDDLTLLAGTHLLQSLRVNHARVHVERGDAEALEFGVVGRVHVRLGDGLREPVALYVADTR